VGADILERNPAALHRLSQTTPVRSRRGFQERGTVRSGMDLQALRLLLADGLRSRGGPTFATRDARSSGAEEEPQTSQRHWEHENKEAAL